METLSFLRIAICASAFLCALVLSMRLVGVLSAAESRNRAVNRVSVGSNSFALLMRNGVSVLHRPVARVLRIPPIEDALAEMVTTLRVKGIQTNSEALASVLAALALGVGLVTGIVSMSLICGVVCAVASLIVFSMVLSHMRDAQRKALREAIPEVLQLIKACFQVGYTLPQTIREVCRNTTGPLNDLFVEVQGVLSTGGTVDDALRTMRESSPEGELVFLAVALEVQHRTGGSMQHVLEIAIQSVMDELTLKRTMRTQTAQAKLSAQIVTAMPFVLVGMFSLVSPDFLLPFFSSGIGLALLVIALAMQAAGIVLVRKMLKVEVS